MAGLRLGGSVGTQLTRWRRRLPAALRGRSLKRAERLFLVGCLLYTAIAQFATNSLRSAEGDATLFAYGGRLVRAGYIPYRDF